MPWYPHAAQIFSIAMITTVSLSADTAWQKTIWQGEAAWSSSQGAVRAVVSEARERLIYLGALDGSANLINAPVPQIRPDEKNRSPNQGGHRFWLGPQSRWIWPPPVDWEYASAVAVKVENSVLILQQPHHQTSYPAITREYAWEGSRMRCTARWRDDGRPYFGLHVVPVDTPFTVTARLVKWDEVPAGMVAARMVNPEPPIQLPHPSITVEGDHASLHYGIKVAKVGFVPQALVIDRPRGWKLAVLPGPYEGVAVGSADHGYLSQVWVGRPEDDLAELEQLSPYLLGDAHGQCASSIYIEATPPAP